MADPDPIGDLLARHDALLKRVTVLERAIEKALIFHEAEQPKDVQRVLRRALGG